MLIDTVVGVIKLIMLHDLEGFLSHAAHVVGYIADMIHHLLLGVFFGNPVPPGVVQLTV